MQVSEVGPVVTASLQRLTGAARADGAQLWLVRAGSPAEVATLAQTPRWHRDIDGLGGFGVLLAWEGEAPAFEQVSELARVLIGEGLFYLGAWGPGSARVEYAVDVTDVTMQMDASDGPDAAIVVTTAFGSVPLEEALFELWELAPRDEGKLDGPARVVVVLGGAQALAHTVRDRAANRDDLPTPDAT